MSTSFSWEVNIHITRCTSPMFMVLQYKLVSGWGLGKQRSASCSGTMWLGRHYITVVTLYKHLFSFSLSTFCLLWRHWWEVSAKTACPFFGHGVHLENWPFTSYFWHTVNYRGYLTEIFFHAILYWFRSNNWTCLVYNQIHYTYIFLTSACMTHISQHSSTSAASSD